MFNQMDHSHLLLLQSGVNPSLLSEVSSSSHVDRESASDHEMAVSTGLPTEPQFVVLLSISPRHMFDMPHPTSGTTVLRNLQHPFAYQPISGRISPYLTLPPQRVSSDENYILHPNHHEGASPRAASIYLSKFHPIHSTSWPAQ